MPDRDPVWRVTREARIAYFSMEIALASEIPTYSGGLGMFAGDAVRSAADLDIPLIAVTLVRDAASLYEKLERAVLPTYYDDRRVWVAIMKGAIARGASLFNSHRMMLHYAVEAYLH